MCVHMCVGTCMCANSHIHTHSSMILTVTYNATDHNTTLCGAGTWTGCTTTCTRTVLADSTIWARRWTSSTGKRLCHCLEYRMLTACPCLRFPRGSRGGIRLAVFGKSSWLLALGLAAAGRCGQVLPVDIIHRDCWTKRVEGDV